MLVLVERISGFGYEQVLIGFQLEGNHVGAGHPHVYQRRQHLGHQLELNHRSALA